MGRYEQQVAREWGRRRGEAERDRPLTGALSARPDHGGGCAVLRLQDHGCDAEGPHAGAGFSRREAARVAVTHTWERAALDRFMRGLPPGATVDGGRSGLPHIIGGSNVAKNWKWLLKNWVVPTKYPGVWELKESGHIVRTRVVDPTTGKTREVRRVLPDHDAAGAFTWLQEEIAWIKAGLVLIAFHRRSASTNTQRRCSRGKSP